MKAYVAILCLFWLGYAHSQGCDSVSSNWGGKTWLIAIGQDYGAHEYLSEGGYIQGFGRDIVNQVCAAAGINCRIVWSQYNKCWDSTSGSYSFGGAGLMGRWFDGCVGWYTTVDRIHTFDFSMPYLKAPSAYFYVKPGASFDPNNISGKKIAFVEAWASDERCLARQSNLQGNFLPDGKAVYANNPADFVNMIKTDQVDAGFTTDTTMDPYVLSGDVQQVSSRAFMCMIAGNSVMVRKDSDLLPHWNRGFMKIRNNGDFTKLCQDTVVKHGAQGDIHCVDT